MSSRTGPTSSALKILQVYSSDTETSDSDNESSTDNNGESLPKSQAANDTCVCPYYDKSDLQLKGDASLPLKRRRIDELAENSYENQISRISGQCRMIVKDSSSIPSKLEHSQVQPLLPTVPNKILDMFSNNEEGKPQDNPEMHSGRVRSFPHVRGNWVSYVSISCPESSDVIAAINELINTVGEPVLSNRSLHLIDEKHVSLSRTLSFRHHWIDSFTDNLKRVANQFERFHICFDKFDVYTNDEKSRTFIGMKIISTANLLSMVKQCDDCLEEFQLEPYYKDPSFHVSCAWMLGDQSAWAEQNLIPYLNDKWSHLVENGPNLPFISVSALEFKTGNKLYRFSFMKSVH